MRFRPLSLLLVPVLAMLLVGTRDRARPREVVAWSPSVVATDSPARLADAYTRVRTVPVRLGERHGARSEDGPPAARHEVWLVAIARRIVGRVADAPAHDAGARALAFTYDATAPPALRVSRYA